jgi:Fur family ferric uptake transcriptional regulator
MNFSNYLQQIETGGIRLTACRLNILRVLFEHSETALTADQVYQSSIRCQDSMALTTVYRGLEYLVHNQLVEKLDFGEGKARYKITFQRSEHLAHQHLVCTGCHKLIPFGHTFGNELALLQKIISGLTRKYNFAISDRTIQFYGRCNNCKTSSSIS